MILGCLCSVEHLHITLPAVAPAFVWLFWNYTNTANHNSSASSAHHKNNNNNNI